MSESFITNNSERYTNTDLVFIDYDRLNKFNSFNPDTCIYDNCILTTISKYDINKNFDREWFQLICDKQTDYSKSSLSNTINTFNKKDGLFSLDYSNKDYHIELIKGSYDNFHKNSKNE